VQLEPAWGPPVDTATGVRATALVALARIEGTGCLTLLVDALTDPEKEVRAAAAVALGAVGSDGAGLVLRLKVRLGDADPDVLSECLGGLLAVDPAGNLDFVSSFLTPVESPMGEAAALALGRSRLIEALEPLRNAFDRSISVAMRARLLLSIAILRRPAACEYLLTLLRDADESTAIDALTALKVYAADSRVREQVEAIVQTRKGPRLRASFERDFGRADS
jgi:HEAT repeat protein